MTQILFANVIRTLPLAHLVLLVWGKRLSTLLPRRGGLASLVAAPGSIGSASLLLTWCVGSCAAGGSCWLGGSVSALLLGLAGLLKVEPPGMMAVELVCWSFVK